MVRPTMPLPDGLLRRDEAYLKNLPPALVAEVEAAGGLWWGGDHYLTREQIVADARERGITALRLDFRDLGLLADLPATTHLVLSSDGRPVLDPVAGLTRLRALVLHVSALRGELDPLGFEDLRWLKLGLGGKGGAAVLPSILRGHPRLEDLAVSETKARSVAELVPAFPNLRRLRIHFADHLRTLGDLTPVAATLRCLELDFTGLRTLDGIEVLTGLEELVVIGGKVDDLTPLEALPNLSRTDLNVPATRG